MSDRIFIISSRPSETRKNTKNCVQSGPKISFYFYLESYVLILCNLQAHNFNNTVAFSWCWSAEMRYKNDLLFTENRFTKLKECPLLNERQQSFLRFTLLLLLYSKALLLSKYSKQFKIIGFYKMKTNRVAVNRYVSDNNTSTSNLRCCSVVPFDSKAKTF